MSDDRSARAGRCEACWVGGSLLLLGGGSLAVTGVSGFAPSAIGTRLFVCALLGFVLAILFCPARRPGSGDAGGPGIDDGPGDGSSDGDGD